jgi:glucose-6-phosphate dehydrogenase assembly protein OpcA
MIPMVPMPPANGATSSAPPGFVALDAGNVDDALANRWEALALNGEAPVSRACTLNLLSYVENLADMAEVSAIVDRLAESHPIRAIGFSLDDSIPDGMVRTWIGDVCETHADRAHICSEDVALAAHSNGAARIASSITSSLKRDVPAMLWWRGGSPFVTRLFRQVAPLVDKIIVDSVRFGDGAASLDTLRRLSEYRGGSAAVSDLNWERTRAWRATIAACFDDPAVLALIDDFDRCTIECTASVDGPIGGPSRALLFAGWLVNRRPALAGRGTIVGRRGAKGAEGSIASVTLLSSRSKASLAVTWDVKGNHLDGCATDAAGAEIRCLRFAADPQDDASLLERCIATFDRDRLFDEVLRAE